MKRGDLYRVQRANEEDPRKWRMYVIVSRQILADTRFSSVICAPIYSASQGLATQVPVGIEEGLKHESSIHCDDLVSILKSKLTYYVGRLTLIKLQALDEALKIALALED